MISPKQRGRLRIASGGRAMRKSNFFAGIFGLGLAAFVLFEDYEVFAARRATPELFARYEQQTNHGAHLPDALTPERAAVLIKVQDPDFWSHHGVDPGAPLTTTTVTQSTVKKLYFSDFKKGFAKIAQSLIAYFAVTPLTSKSAQLAAFLDVNDFEGRAREWFGKNLAALDDEQFLSVIATNNNPHQIPGTPENAERVTRIKNYLAGHCQRRGLADVWLDACGQDQKSGG
jgi:membrane carboxypeptidase/penicillin-binding protein PbpC